MQTDEPPAPRPLLKRQKSNNVIGVGHVSCLLTVVHSRTLSMHADLFRDALCWGPKGTLVCGFLRTSLAVPGFCESRLLDAVHVIGNDTWVDLPHLTCISRQLCMFQASGRPWKAPAERAGAQKNPLLSTSWEKKMKLKAESQAFKTLKKEAVTAHKEKLAVSQMTDHLPATMLCTTGTVLQGLAELGMVCA